MFDAVLTADERGRNLLEKLFKTVRDIDFKDKELSKLSTKVFIEARRSMTGINRILAKDKEIRREIWRLMDIDQNLELPESTVRTCNKNMKPEYKFLSEQIHNSEEKCVYVERGSDPSKIRFYMEICKKFGKTLDIYDWPASRAQGGMR